MTATAGSRLTVVALAVALALGILGAAPASAAAPATATTHAAAEQALAGKINAERTARGLAPLAVNVQLTGVARGWTGVMASSDTMDHNPRLGDLVPAPWTALAENVGWALLPGGAESEVVENLHQAFMNSPDHRDNVLGDYNQVGVGVAVTATGKLWATVDFMAGTTPPPAAGQVAEAVRVSRELFGDAAADFAVLTRGDVFADALGGAGLAGGDAPVLFTPGPRDGDPDPVLQPATREEIDRVLGGNGTVYLLGGTSAVSAAVEGELARDGYTVRRLAGASRVETSVKVAEETIVRRGATGEVLLARADDWADAVTGGAYAAYSGSPVVLTGRDTLHPAVAAFLAAGRPERRWALGGAAALGDAVVAAAGATRVAGPDRTATAVQVAERLWGRTAATAGDRFVSTPGYAGDGWAYALAYAPWSAANQGPQLLVGDTVPASVQTYLDQLGYGGGVAGRMQAASVVPQPVVTALEALVAG